MLGVRLRALHVTFQPDPKPTGGRCCVFPFTGAARLGDQQCPVGGGGGLLPAFLSQSDHPSLNSRLFSLPSHLLRGVGTAQKPRLHFSGVLVSFKTRECGRI